MEGVSELSWHCRIGEIQRLEVVVHHGNLCLLVAVVWTSQVRVLALLTAAAGSLQVLDLNAMVSCCRGVCL